MTLTLNLPYIALPLYALGLSANSVLFYRYGFAVLLFGLWLHILKKRSLKISLRQAAYLLPLGIVFAISSLTLFTSYNYIDAGIASTILFIYPIMVAAIMTMFFKEKMSIKMLSSIIITTIGIALLYKGKPDENMNIFGVTLVMISALSYAVYMVALKKLNALRGLNSSILTFYAMAFGLLVFLFNLHFGLDLQSIPSQFGWMCAIALGIIPTIVSLEMITISIKLIGPTQSAILGALEPVTAIFFGVLVFHEQLTPRIIAGIALIFSAVMLIVLNKRTKAKPN